MSENKKTWDFVEGVAARGVLTTQEDLSKSIVINKDPEESPEGIIAKFKAKQIERSAALTLFKKWSEGRIEIAKHQIEGAVKVKKKSTDVEVQRILSELDSLHLLHLQQLDMKNLTQRMSSLKDLSAKTANMLRGIESEDWPENIIKDTVDGILDLRRRFYGKIMDE